MIELEVIPACRSYGLGVTSPIIGPRTMEQLEGSMRAMKVFVTRAIAEKALAMVRQAAETEVWPEDRAIPREVLLEKVRGMAGLLCLLTDPIDGTLMDAA